MAKVSVVIPNYNHAKYLSARIQSVLDQTYRDFDVLILDDCSVDDSRRVIDSFLPDSRIRAIFNEQNSGSTFRQWAKGLAETSGEYVWIAESDDLADPRFLETLLPLLEQSTRVGMAVSATHTIDENDVRNETPFVSYVERLGMAANNLVTMNSDLVMNGRDYIRRHLWVPWTTIPNASAIVFRRAALAQSIPFGTSMKLCGDTMIYCHLLETFDIARSAQPLNVFRQHSQNVRSNTPGELWISEALAIQRFIRSRFGAPSWPKPVWQFFTQLLLVGDRSPTSGKVPLRRIPKVLQRAFHRDAMLCAWSLRVMLTEVLAGIAKRFFIRPKRVG